MTANSASPVVTRFAPSPTGYLHVGGARTALFSWLMARRYGGRFLLRIEDTDLARSTDEACRQLLDDLRWLGLEWDNAELVYQSKRREVYNAIIEDLITRDLAYEAYETPAELDAQRKSAEREKRQYVFRRPQYSDEQIRQYRGEGRVPIIRLAMPVKEYRFTDQVLGKEIVMPAEEAQDFVIRKADGMPTYHFAVVVDDAQMGITHILRGQEHTKNTFYHLALQEALGYARPVYAHLPIILNMDGSKMGKRDRDKKLQQMTATHFKGRKPNETASILAQKMTQTVRDHRDRLAAGGQFEPALLETYAADEARITEWLEKHSVQMGLLDQWAIMQATGVRDADLPEILIHDFRRNGYIPEALLNFLALLGWNPGGDREHMSMDELVRLFSIDGIGKSNAKFDRTKLLAFNTETAKTLAPPRTLAAFKSFLAANPDSPVRRADDETLARLLEMKKGFRTFREVEEASRFFFVTADQVVYDPQAVDKVLLKNERQGEAALKDVRVVFASSDWTAAALEAAIKAYCERTGLGLGKVAQPIRVAVTGSTISPPIFESLEMLGRDATLARVDRCLEVCGAGAD